MPGLDDFLALLSGQRQQQAVPQGPPQPTPTLQPTPQSQLPMSPQAIEDLRKHAQLLQAGVGQHIPLSRGWGAIAQGVSGLMGGLEQRQAANELARQRQNLANAVGGVDTTAMPSTSAPSALVNGSPPQVNASPSADLSYGSGIVPHDVARAAIWNNEADHRGYGTVGPEVPARGGHPAGHALGGYQVMSYDLPNRLAAAGLPPMNEAEFLRSPETQEAQFKHEFTNLQNKYGSFNDAASVWFSGRPMAQAGNASDAGPGYKGSTVPEYISKANGTIAKLSRNQPTQAMAFNGALPPGGGISPTAAPTVNALNNQGAASPAVSPQQYAQALSPQSTAPVPNYQQMVRDQARRLILAGETDPQKAIASATAIVEGNLKYQPQFSQPDEYGNVTKSVAGQPPSLHIKGSPILESYEPVKGVHQYRLKYRDPMIGVTTIQPADASGRPTGPALALGQGTGPQPAVAQAPLGAPPGATAAPAGPPATVGPAPAAAAAQPPVAPAWPQTRPLGMADGMAPGNSAAQQIAARSGTQPPADWMSALRTPPPGARPAPAPGVKVAGPVASLPPAASPIPPSPQPRTEGTLSAPSGVPPMPTGADATPENLTNWQQAVEQETERRKEVGKKGGEAMMVPIGEAMKESKTAPQMLNALNVIEDVAKTHGDKIVTGGFGEPYMKLAQTVNGVSKLFGGTGDVMGDTANPETMRKMNAFLASAATQAMTARGTQFDFATNMRAMPGNLENSIKGTLWLTNILKQITQQNLQLSKLAANKNNWDNWGDVQEKFYNEHKLLNPATGKELGVMDEAKAPQSEPSPTKAMASLPPEIVAELAKRKLSPQTVPQSR